MPCTRRDVSPPASMYGPALGSQLLTICSVQTTPSQRSYAPETLSISPVTVVTARAMRCHRRFGTRRAGRTCTKHAVTRTCSSLLGADGPSRVRGGIDGPAPCPAPRLWLSAPSSLRGRVTSEAGGRLLPGRQSITAQITVRPNMYTGKEAHCQRLPTRLRTRLATQQARELDTRHLDDGRLGYLVQRQVRGQRSPVECCTVLS